MTKKPGIITLKPNLPRNSEEVDQQSTSSIMAKRPLFQKEQSLKNFIDNPTTYVEEDLQPDS